MVSCPRCGWKARPRENYCAKCGKILRPPPTVVSIRTDRETAKFWRRQKWGNKGKAFRVAVHLLKRELDGGKRLEELILADSEVTKSGSEPS